MLSFTFFLVVVSDTIGFFKLNNISLCIYMYISYFLYSLIFWWHLGKFSWNTICELLLSFVFADNYILSLSFTCLQCCTKITLFSFILFGTFWALSELRQYQCSSQLYLLCYMGLNCCMAYGGYGSIFLFGVISRCSLPNLIYFEAGVVEGDWIMWDYTWLDVRREALLEVASPWGCDPEGVISLTDSVFSVSLLLSGWQNVNSYTPPCPSAMLFSQLNRDWTRVKVSFYSQFARVRYCFSATRKVTEPRFFTFVYASIIYKSHY